MRKTTAQDLARQHIETIRQAAADNGITHEALANATGLQQTNVGRTLTGRYMPRLDIFLNLAAAAGVKITLTVQSRKITRP